MCVCMWGNRHPKHYNGMRQMGAAALSIMSCCVEQSVLRILKVVYFSSCLLDLVLFTHSPNPMKARSWPGVPCLWDAQT